MESDVMNFFWKRRQEPDNTEKEPRYDVEKAITAICGRLRFLEVLTADLVAELPPAKRDRLLQHLREVVRELKILPPPIALPPGKEQEFHDELRRAVEILIENSDTKVRPR
jgi:hypothetical protein